MKPYRVENGAIIGPFTHIPIESLTPEVVVAFLNGAYSAGRVDSSLAAFSASVAAMKQEQARRTDQATVNSLRKFPAQGIEVKP